MSDSTGSLDQAVILNARTTRSVLARIVFFAAWAAAGDLAFVLGGWGSFALFYFPFLCAVGCLNWSWPASGPSPAPNCADGAGCPDPAASRLP